jgi:hypothetical protein
MRSHTSVPWLGSAAAVALAAGTTRTGATAAALAVLAFLRPASRTRTKLYADDADLDGQVHDLLGDISNEAELRSCFIEFDVREKGTERSW